MSYCKFRLNLLLLALSIVGASALTAQQAKPRIEHFPVTDAESNRPVKVNIRLRAAQMAPVNVRLYYKSPQDQSFSFIEMQNNFDRYSAIIPPENVSAPAIAYFIVVVYKDQSIESVPATNPYGNPFKISVRKIEGEKPDSGMQPDQRSRPGQTNNPIYILAPEPETEITNDDFVIAAGIEPSKEGVDLTSIKVLIDGRDVTRFLKKSDFLLTVALGKIKLSGGEHKIAIHARNRKGHQLPPLVWKTVIAREQNYTRFDEDKLFQGRVYSEIRQEKFSGRTLNANSIGTNFSGHAGGLDFKANVYMTTLSDPRLQARNRYSLSISNKYIQLGFGDVYPNYNELALWGRRIRGMSAAINLGLVNFQFSLGKTRRTISALKDSVSNIISFGTYAQNLTAGRISFGSGNSFQLGFFGLKVKDDVGSLNAGEGSYTPQDNIVPGADLFISLASRRIQIRSSVAFSLLTKDITNGPATIDEIQDVLNTRSPVNPADLSRWLIVNESTTPLDPRDLNSLAHTTTVKLNFLRNYLSFGYKNLGAEYNSLGQSFLRNNIRGFFLDDRLDVYDNRVYVNLGVKDFDDNFNTDDGNPLTDLRTISIGMSAHIAPDLPFISFNLRNYSRQNSANLPLWEDNVTRDNQISLGYKMNMSAIRHTLNYNIIDSRLKDDRSIPGNTSKVFSSSIHSISLKSEFEQPFVSLLTFSSNRNESIRDFNAFNFKSFSGRGEYTFMNGNLKAFAGVNSVSSSGFQKLDTGTLLARVDYQQVAFQMGVFYNYRQKHRAALDIDIIRFNDRGATFSGQPQVEKKNPSFTNSIFRLFYEYRL